MTEQLTYRPQDIANWFLNQIDPDAGDSITHLKLQKLVYYAEAWALALFDTSLFEDEFEAWAHGPVVRSLYNEYRHCGWEPIMEEVEEPPEFEEDVQDLLQEVFRVYGEHSAKTLEKLTHREQPWRNAREGYAPEEWSNEKISKEDMKEFYSRLYEQAQQKADS
jgi:uncharacterized phage-associated protein